jgi:PAS domain S-box-containing protein
MNDPRYSETQLLDVFLKSAQYIVRLTTQQDVWDHLGKLITTYFPTDWAAFARRDPAGGITLHHVTPPELGDARQFLTDEVRSIIADVLDSGFLASRIIQVSALAMVAFLPVVEGHTPREVMLIGHKSSEPLPNELLNIYLAIAGLAGTALERLHNENELNQHRAYLEDLVKERTAELAQAQRRNELILNSVREGICGMDLEGRITFVNPFAAHMIGWDAAELIGRDAHATFHHTRPDGCAHPAKECLVHSTLKNGDARFVTDEEFARKDGSRFPVEYVTAPIEEGGRTVGAVLAFRDIADRKQAAEKVRQALEELARSNKDLEQFAHVASHDLQEPLRVVSGFLQLLESRYKPKLDDTAREYIAFSVEGAMRMSHLISDLLAYSRVAAGEQKPQTIDANQALAAALANLRASIHEAGASITHDTLPTVRCDASQLTQLLQNLIGNALKFREAGRTCQVHVGAEKKDNQWVFSVRDNGIGIPKDAFDRIFVIFQRLHTRDKFTGTGIGLAICKRIIERCGGRIWLESTVGEGATFYFSFPDDHPAAETTSRVQEPL